MKKNNKVIYDLINCIVFIAIILYILKFNKNIFTLEFKYLLIAIIPFICIHAFRIIRQYIILMEENIKMKKLVKSYLISSLTNTILPFRIGELYKIYLYGYEIKNYKKSTIAVLTDKFFDCIFLLIAFIIIETIAQKELSIITVILLIFVAFIIIMYISFENTYLFLNKYLIINKNKKSGIKCLKILDEAKNIFDSIKNMIKKREIIIGILTILSWISEFIFVYIIFKFINVGNIELNKFILYINNSFLGIQNELSNYYINITTIVAIVFIIIVFINSILKRNKGE